MPITVRGLACLTGLALAVPAGAQSLDAPAIGVIAAPASDRGANLPNFRMPRDLSRAPEPERNGLIAALPLGERLTLGVGRFPVLELPRARTHTEREPRPADVRRRERGIAAIGVSLRF